MRTSKRYSSVTIKKRVDHERTRKHKTAQKPAPGFCSVCGLLYLDGRWTEREPESARRKHRRFAPPKKLLCPACKAEAEGKAGGFLYLEVDVNTESWGDIQHLLEREAGRALADNPLNRIIGSALEEEGRIVILTSTEHLAQRLGRFLESARGGEVRYDFSHENKLVRVYWRP